MRQERASHSVTIPILGNPRSWKAISENLFLDTHSRNPISGISKWVEPSSTPEFPFLKTISALLGTTLQQTRVLAQEGDSLDAIVTETLLVTEDQAPLRFVRHTVKFGFETTEGAREGGWLTLQPGRSRKPAVMRLLGEGTPTSYISRDYN